MENTENYIFDVTEADFSDKVIEGSVDTLICVDFWAPWCGPCKQLTPILEKVINKCNGKIVLAKINIDENQQIAAQLRIQSIPTVMIFKNKQIVNAFQGALPENKIIEFLESSLGEKLEKDNSVFYNENENLINNKKFEEAVQNLEEFLVENSEDLRAINMYLNCLISLSKIEDVNNFISGLSEDLVKSNEIQSIIANLEIIQKNTGGPSIEQIESSLEKNPNDLKTIIDLSEKYFANNLYEKSFDLLLSKYNNDQKNKDKIKKNILKYFEVLGNDNQITKAYRKKLSSIIFS